MKKTFAIIPMAALLLALAAPGILTAQPIKYAQAGMGFLQINVGARSAAMAGTQAGMSGDANAMFTNPAGLGLMEGFSVMSSVTNWIADIKHYGIGGAMQVGNLGTFGVNGIWMDYGSFRRTSVPNSSDPSSDQNRGYIDEGTFNVTNFALGISYARQITGQFYVGGNARYALEDLPDMEIEHEIHGRRTEKNRLNNYVFDFGTLYYPGFKDFRFGMSVRNFSNQNDYYDQRFELPLTFDFGVAMDVLKLLPSEPGATRNSTLLVAADWLHPRDYSERLHLGLEYGFQDLVFLRGGYKFNYDEESLSAGLGVKTGFGGFGLRADYAYTAFGDLFGSVHRITLGISAK